MRILMVCLGNICRSPLAEGILKHKIEEKYLDWIVDSAGTSGWHEGALPDIRSIAVGKAHNVDITYQRSRPFVVSDFQNFDLIYVMDSSNYQNVLKVAPNEEVKKKVIMIMNEVKPGWNQNVPDPYWDDNGFEKVYQMLDNATDAILEKYLNC